MSRGIDRQPIFSDDRDRYHFIELLETATQRYHVRLHAYVLMSNHFHLLLETPEGNQAVFMQWLKLAYSMWHNVRHDRVGPLFQGRYRSIPVEDANWIYALSLYLHLNPLRLAHFKLSRLERQGESQELKPLSREEATRRLRELRTYPWSSYRAYAGYGHVPEWLTTQALLERAGNARSYRKDVSQRLTSGEPGDVLERLRDAVAIGTEQFRARIKSTLAAADRDIAGRREGRRKIPFEKVIASVESVLGETVRRGSRGGTGRDIVLLLARDHSGLSLREIGEKMGGLDYGTVHMSIRRLLAKMEKEKRLRRVIRESECRLLNVET